MVAQQPLNLNTIAEKFDMTRQAISLHVKILTECGLIVINQQGRERYCFIQGEKLKEVEDWLDNFRKIWENRFDKLDKILAKMKQTNKKNK